MSKKKSKRTPEQLTRYQISSLQSLVKLYQNKGHKFGESRTCILCKRFSNAAFEYQECLHCPWLLFTGSKCIDQDTMWNDFVNWNAKHGRPGLRIRQINKWIRQLEDLIKPFDNPR